MNFDYEVQKVLDEEYPLVNVSGFIKASEKSKKLYNKMKSQIKSFIKSNNAGYNLNLNMVNFEAYFCKTKQISFSVFNCSDGRVCIIDNIKGEFFVINKDKEN